MKCEGGGIFRVWGVCVSRLLGVLSCLGVCFRAVRLFISRVARIFIYLFFVMELSKTGDCRPERWTPPPCAGGWVLASVGAYMQQNEELAWSH